MRINVFWAAPFVLPFFISGTGLALFWLVGFQADNTAKSVLSGASLFFGVPLGVAIAADAANQNIGWVQIGGEK